MTPPLWLALVLLFGGLYALGRWSRRHPHDPWVYALWYLALGPRTDVADMTRRELFESAGSFVTWTLLCVIALQMVMLASPEHASPWLQGLSFGLGFVLVMGIFGALYMLLRAVLRRRAYLSRDRFSAELRLMPFWVRRRDWPGLDGHFRRFAEHTCGAQVAAAAAAVDLGSYHRALAEALQLAVSAADREPAAVIAYLHRPHEDWSGAFCVYSRAAAASGGDERRMGTCVAEIPGPPCTELARLFFAHGDTLNTVALYLIARTVAALGRCLDELPPDDVTVCLAIEGDGGLLWLREASAPAHDTRDRPGTAGGPPAVATASGR
jgi:hypothetical protein